MKALRALHMQRAIFWITAITYKYKRAAHYVIMHKSSFLDQKKEIDCLYGMNSCDRKMLNTAFPAFSLFPIGKELIAGYHQLYI